MKSTQYKPVMQQQTRCSGRGPPLHSLYLGEPAFILATQPVEVGAGGECSTRCSHSGAPDLADFISAGAFSVTETGQGSTRTAPLLFKLLPRSDRQVTWSHLTLKRAENANPTMCQEGRKMGYLLLALNCCPASSEPSFLSLPKLVCTYK